MQPSSDIAELAFLALPEPCMAFDHDCVVAGFNPAATEYVRRTFGKELRTGTPVHNYLGEDLLTSFESHARRALAGETVETFRRIPSTDGAVLAFALTYVPIRNTSGTIIGAALRARDETEVRNRHEEVRDNFVRYLHLYDNADVGLLTFAIADGALTDCNPYFYRLLGYESHDDICRSIRLPEILDDHNEYAHIVQRLRTERRVPISLTLRRRDGSTVGVRGIFRRSEDGTYADGTFRAAPANTHIPSNTRDRSCPDCIECVINEAETIVLRIDGEGIVTFANPYAGRFFGYDVNDLIGRTIYETIVPETEDGGRNLRDILHSVLHHPTEFRSNENQNVLRTGERVWISWSNTPVYGEDGSVREVLSIGHDITARKNAEERLAASEARTRALLNTIPDLMIRFNHNGAILECHAPDAEIFPGCPDELVGKGIGEIGLPEEHIQCAMESIELALATGEVHTFEAELDLAPGRRTFECRMMQCGHGEVLAMVRDITERKAAERERESLIGELREALERVRALRKLLPICASCRKIRDDDGYWSQLDEYLRVHADIEFTDGLCPDCTTRLYPDYDERIRNGEAGSGI